jgi:tripartite-type tricarboxylate transporter receptor subunit TctC
MFTWFGMVGPKGIPPAIVAELNAAIVEALKAPDIVALIEKQGMTPAPSTPAEFKKFVEDSIAIIQRAATSAAIPKVDD